MFKQILLDRTTRNIWSTVGRTYMLILGLEGLTSCTYCLLAVTAYHDESNSSSPHKDRSDQRFHVERFSDSGNSRRFDSHENVSVPGGFMTSTPQTKSQAVFSPPKSYQVGNYY